MSLHEQYKAFFLKFQIIFYNYKFLRDFKFAILFKKRIKKAENNAVLFSAVIL